MALEGLKRYYVLLILLLAGSASFGQNVPFGIFYQAVARDNNGKEFANKDIDVKFSIISVNPLGLVVYEELHTKVTTSKFGVFSLIIGSGTPTGGLYDDLSKIQWSQANHFIKVEVKFDNDFIDMGTMQFLAVPYALYAQKSLDPGPPGPKGDDGDPASDNQYLSYIGDTLSISNGNKVGLANQIQDLVLDVNNKLKITKNTLATAIDLSKFNQTLSFNPTDYKLSISGGSIPVDLTALKNDADADPTNELQTLSYNKNTGDLTISSKNTVNLENPVGFKFKKSISQTGLTILTTYPFINSDFEFNDGAGYDAGTGSFAAPMAGIYTFFIL